MTGETKLDFGGAIVGMAIFLALLALGRTCVHGDTPGVSDGGTLVVMWIVVAFASVAIPMAALDVKRARVLRGRR